MAADKVASRPPISDDGRWWWDGSAWRPLFSADGRHRWTGSDWAAVDASAVQPQGDPPAHPPGQVEPAPAAEASSPEADPADPANTWDQAPADAWNPGPIEPAPEPRWDPLANPVQVAPVPLVETAHELAPPGWKTAAAAAEEAAAGPRPAQTLDERPSWLPHNVELPKPVRARTPATPEFAFAIPAEPDRKLEYQKRVGKSASPVGMKSLLTLLMIAVTGAAVLFSGRLSAPPVDSGQPVLVASKTRLVYQPNTVHRYHIHEQVHGALTLPTGQSADSFSDVDYTEAWRIVSVAPNGDITIAFRFETLTGTDDGEPIRFNPKTAKEITVVLSPDGRIVSGGTNGAASSKPQESVPGGDQQWSILPDHDVRPGDSWGTRFDRANPLGQGTMHYSTTNTFVRWDEYFGKKAAVIETRSELPIDALLNIRDLLALYGDDGSIFPAGSTVKYVGSDNGDVVSFVDTEAREIVSAQGTFNFSFDMSFNGLPNTPAFKDLLGRWHYAGHVTFDLVELGANPKSA